MQEFSEREVKELINDGTIKREKIRVICLHSDNGGLEWLRVGCRPHPLNGFVSHLPSLPQPTAAQHFKSSKSLEWFTRMNKILPNGVAFTWDFGAPGHGKGVWDGLAGE